MIGSTQKCGAASVPRCGPVTRRGVDYAARANSNSSVSMLSFAVTNGGPLRGCHPGVLHFTIPSVDPGSPPSREQQSGPWHLPPHRSIGVQPYHYCSRGGGVGYCPPVLPVFDLLRGTRSSCARPRPAGPLSEPVLCRMNTPLHQCGRAVVGCAAEGNLLHFKGGIRNPLCS